MIRELADYEKALESVGATESSLLETLSFATAPTTHAPPGASTQTPAPHPADEEILEPISDRKTARALLLFEDETRGRPVGLALYYFTYSTWTGRPGIYLEDLFVRPEFRGRGYGRALLRRLAQLVGISLALLSHDTRVKIPCTSLLQEA